MPTPDSHTDPQAPQRVLWLGSLLAFVLAGLTGALYRFKLLYGFPSLLSPTHIRHAHSHLMFFSWIIPPLFLLATVHISSLTRKAWPRWSLGVIAATFLLGLTTYLPFLFYGYGPASLGRVTLPLAPILSSWNILAWYLFIGLYLYTTWGIPRSLPLRLWDLAFLFLALSSMGAWGRLLLVRLNISDPFWSALFVHLFLVLFTDGWVVFALLALAIHDPAPFPATTPRGKWFLALGLPLSVLLSVPSPVLPKGLLLPAGIGGILVALGIFLMVFPLLTRSPKKAWRIPLCFLLLKAIMELGYTFPSIAQWALKNGFRIPYLHILLLGFASLGIFVAVREELGPSWVPDLRWTVFGVVLLILALLPLTGLWPSSLGGRWTQLFALGTDLVLPAIVGVLFFQILSRTSRA